MKLFFTFLLTLAACNLASGQIFNHIPRQYSLEKYMPPVKHQLDRNTCAAFATLGALECAINIKYGVLLNLSEQHLFAMAVDSATGLSGYVECGNYLRYHGAVLERDWPYRFSIFGEGLPCYGFAKGGRSTPRYCYSQQLPPDSVTARKISFKMKIRIQKGAREICRTISENHPVIFWIPAEFQNYSEESGDLWVDTNHFELRENTDGHFVVAYGYDLDKDLFYIQNSFGKTWGNNGRGTLSFRYFRKIHDRFAAYFLPDSIYGLPQVIPPLEQDSVWLYGAETNAYFRQDTALCLEIRGYQSPRTLNAFDVVSELVVRKKSDSSAPFELLRLQGADSPSLRDTCIRVTGHSISGPMGMNNRAFSTTTPFAITFPGHVVAASSLTKVMQDPSQEVRIRTRINWHTDTHGRSCYQEYLTPIQGGFQASE